MKRTMVITGLMSALSALSAVRLKDARDSNHVPVEVAPPAPTKAPRVHSWPEQKLRQQQHRMKSRCRK